MHQQSKPDKLFLRMLTHQSDRGGRKQWCSSMTRQLFRSNEDQSVHWGEKGTKVMKPKSRGSGIMVSNFIDEHNGFLALTDEEYEQAKRVNPRAKKYARQFF